MSKLTDIIDFYIEKCKSLKSVSARKRFLTIELKNLRGTYQDISDSIASQKNAETPLYLGKSAIKQQYEVRVEIKAVLTVQAKVLANENL